RPRDRIMFPRAELTANPLHCVRAHLTNGTVMLSGAKHLSLFASGIAPGFDPRFFASLRMTFSASASKGVEASAYNPPTKQACASEDNTEFQPAPATTRSVREPPRTSPACTHSETGTT